MKSRPIRFVIGFAAAMVSLSCLWMVPPVQSRTGGLSRGLVSVAATLIGWAGGNVRVQGAIMAAPSGSFAVEMKDGCNGITVTIVLCSAMLAFPAAWRHKILGLLLGIAAIQTVNMVRFISLFYLGQYSQSLFEFAHWYLWESLIMLDALVAFWWWVTKMLPRPTVPSAGH